MNPREQSARERVVRLEEGSPEWKILKLVKLIESEKQKLLADTEVMLHPGFPVKLTKEEEKKLVLHPGFPRGFLAMIRNAVETHQLAKPKAPLEELREWAESAPDYPREGSSERALRKWKNELCKWAKQAARREESEQELRNWKNELRRWKKNGPSALVREIYNLDRELHAELDSALETGDIYRWLESKAEAMRAKQSAPDRFEAAFVQALEENREVAEMSLAEAKKHATAPRPRSTTATRVNFTGPKQVLDKLRAETVTRPETIDGREGKFLTPSERTYVLVCGREFASMRRARDAGDKIAKRHGYLWKNAAHG
jgi:hypothetical protein